MPAFKKGGQLCALLKNWQNVDGWFPGVAGQCWFHVRSGSALRAHVKRCEEFEGIRRNEARKEFDGIRRNPNEFNRMLCNSKDLDGIQGDSMQETWKVEIQDL